MPAPLLDLLDARSCFVVGKGGVGKTTTAAALALGLADRDVPVHLLSTDPAHSLGDAFGVRLEPGAETPSPCGDGLVLEELDAPARARAWTGSVRGPIADLVELGTYLDAEDVSMLLDRALPGMDEVMAALRIAELAAGDGVPAGDTTRRLVVDTAPTGHLLRLLDAADVLDGWSAALAAMASKAGAVGSALSGRAIRFAAEDVIDDLRARVDRFRDVVRSDADFVLVTRAEEVVEAETRRLAEELTRRGCTVRAVVEVGGMSDRSAGPPPRFGIPSRDDLVGCEGLRAWGSSAAGAPSAAPDAPATTPRSSTAPHPSRPSGPRPLLDRVAGRDLLLFVGKGGVGKSTCAAAFALALGRERDVLLLSTDPAGSLGDVLGQPVGAEPVRCAPRVVARQIDAATELERFRLRYRERIRTTFLELGIGGSVLDRRVLESIVDMAPPGIDEIFALDAMLDEPGGERTTVIDSAPTGHLIRLLEMPELARSWTHALLRILVKYRAALGLDDVAERLLQLARRLDRLSGSWKDPERTAALVVTHGGTLARLETERLVDSLRRNGTPVAAIICNRSDRAAPDVSGGGVAPLGVTAPSMPRAPIGAERLLDFVERWDCP